MNTTNLKIILLLAAGLCLPACAHAKIRFQKAYLLDPTMNPKSTSGLMSSATQPGAVQTPERASVAGNGFASSSCPTCGT